MRFCRSLDVETAEDRAGSLALPPGMRGRKRSPERTSRPSPCVTRKDRVSKLFLLCGDPHKRNCAEPRVMRN